VKESVPASRHGIVVGGDAVKRVLINADQTSGGRLPSESYGGGEGADLEDSEDGGSTTGSSMKAEELPPPAITRNLLELFQSKEEEAKTSSTFEPRGGGAASGRAKDGSGGQTWKDRSIFVGNAETRKSMEMSVESGDFENDPTADPTLVRESDRHDEDELPEQGTTRNLLAKFQNLSHK